MKSGLKMKQRCVWLKLTGRLVVGQVGRQAGRQVGQQEGRAAESELIRGLQERGSS